MLNLLIVYDNEDLNRGEYFEASHNHLLSNTALELTINRQSINTELSQSNSIDHHTSQFNGNPFIFVAYAHGSSDALHVANSEYINGQNTYLFSETLFYACSCLSAKELGQNLRENGCKVFLGYNAKISSLNPETEPIYYACENAFLAHFLTTDSTIQESMSFMYDKYEEMKRHLATNYSTFDAGVLGNNLNAFEIICNEEDLFLTKEDFVAMG